MQFQLLALHAAHKLIQAYSNIGAEVLHSLLSNISNQKQNKLELIA